MKVFKVENPRSYLHKGSNKFLIPIQVEALAIKITVRRFKFNILLACRAMMLPNSGSQMNYLYIAK